jgi:hypothetical protein
LDEDYLNGGNWSPVKELVKVESGKRSDRPMLAVSALVSGIPTAPMCSLDAGLDGRVRKWRSNKKPRF